ncbi:MAG TPA: asparagine synthase-related protein [Gemmatimonadaceae bacterium]
MALVGTPDIEQVPLVVSHGDWTAIGTVRIDNRAELERWASREGTGLTDLELVLHTVARHGPTYVPQFLGDFAFVVWNDATRIAVAACDAFAVKKLYYVERNGLFYLASRAEALALDERYDVQYLAERLAACIPTPGLSIYAGVKSLPSGTLAELQRGKLTTRRYWSPYEFDIEPTWTKSQPEAAETCRALLAESVRLRLGEGKLETWAQLSGGMDSSSVVSVAQWLATRGAVPNGLAGTITFVDSFGTGADEREYSDAVVRRWGLRNETVIDPPLWHDDQYEPPNTDEPTADIMFHPRDYRLCDIVRGAGGRIVLTGGAGDSLFTGNMFFFADWLRHGQVRPALREMAHRAAVGRASFWELAYRNALLPLLPRALQQRLVRDQAGMPPWVLGRTARRYGLAARASAPSSYAGRVGHKYHDAVAIGISELAAGIPVGLLEDTLDVRHPYLYRPLVEFALRLPPELCARAYARKWVLREAMRGILPDTVRTRVGKGAVFGRLAWSLAAQRTILAPLVQEPILAELGVVDAAKLRASFEAAQHAPDSRERLHADVQHTLGIEAWLRMRSGRWPCGTTSRKCQGSKSITPRQRAL